MNEEHDYLYDDSIRVRLVSGSGLNSSPKTSLTSATIGQTFTNTPWTLRMDNSPLQFPPRQKPQAQSRTGIQSVQWEPLKCTAMSMDFFDCLIQRGKRMHPSCGPIAWGPPSLQTFTKVFNKYQLLVFFSYPPSFGDTLASPAMS